MIIPQPEINIRRPVVIVRLNGLIDQSACAELLSSINPPSLETVANPETVLCQVDDIMRMCLNRTKRREMITESQNRLDNRWEMLSNMNDAREIWQAIGWNAIIGDNKSERPSDVDSAL